MIVAPTPIIQFGTSRFLQAHVDLFVSEALAAGRAVGPITVVQTTASADRAGRLAAFNDPTGFPVKIRGLEQGHPVDREIRVTSILRGLAALDDWPEIRRTVVEDARFLVSNTADAGYRIEGEGRLDLTSDMPSPPPSFPEKLLVLLAARHRAGRDGLIILPCELINRNGDTLRSIVLDLARRNSAGSDLLAWLDERCLWVNSLVDRIVSAPIEPAGAVAEPYALWAIENQPGLRLPCEHQSIRIVEDLGPVERLKLFILNLGHTVLADIWLREDWPRDAIVRGMLRDATVRSRLQNLYAQEVAPGFAANDMGSEAIDYVAATIERFDNPYLDHRLQDIATNHQVKIERRIIAFLEWSKAADLPQPVLKGIVARR